MTWSGDFDRTSLGMKGFTKGFFALAKVAVFGDDLPAHGFDISEDDIIALSVQYLYLHTAAPSALMHGSAGPPRSGYGHSAPVTVFRNNRTRTVLSAVF